VYPSIDGRRPDVATPDQPAAPIELIPAVPGAVTADGGAEQPHLPSHGSTGVGCAGLPPLHCADRQERKGAGVQLEGRGPGLPGCSHLLPYSWHPGLLQFQTRPCHILKHHPNASAIRHLRASDPAIPVPPSDDPVPSATLHHPSDVLQHDPWAPRAQQRLTTGLPPGHHQPHGNGLSRLFQRGADAVVHWCGVWPVVHLPGPSHPAHPEH